MKLFEFEAKNLAKDLQIPVPKGALAVTPEEVKSAAEVIGGPVMVKAQVLVAGRGKAGGIKLARDPPEAYLIAKSLLSSKIKGEQVRSVLVEERLNGVRELYVGIGLDRAARAFAVLASATGGVDIEDIAQQDPGKIVRSYIDPLLGLSDFECREVARSVGCAGKGLRLLSSIIQGLYTLSMRFDCELVEANPLLEFSDRSFVAADLRMIIDDNSLYRHPEFQKRGAIEDADSSRLELDARRKGLAYVELEGETGIIGNGAGLVMATLDMVSDYGGRSANFCDLGGGASIERIASALEVVMAAQHVKVILINIMGGITRCDDVAKGILRIKERMGIDRPIVVRMVGTNEEEGRRILREAGVPTLESMEEAAQRAVSIAKGVPS